MGARQRFYDVLLAPQADSSGEVVGVVVRGSDVTAVRRAQAELRASESRFRGYFEQSLVGVAVTSPEKGLIDVNQAFLDLVGYAREELSDKTWSEITHPDDLAADVAQFDRVMAGEIDAYRLEKRFIRKDGRAVYVDIGVRAVRKDAGDVEYFLALVSDISERKRAEAALRESEARYRSLFDQTPVGIFRSTPEGHLVFVNPAFATIFGYDSPEEMLEVANRTGIAAATYEDPSQRAGIVRDVQESGGDWRIYENRYRRKDGSLFDGRLYLSENRDGANGDAHLFGFVQDVSAQKQALRALQRSAAVLSNGESLAHLGSWEWDVVSGATRVSEEWQRLHGLHGERFAEEEVMATCHPDDREAMRAALARAAAGELYRVDHRIVHPKTHAVRYLKTYGQPRFDEQGRVEAVIGASLDVTERVRADAALREREERLRHALADTVAALGATVAMRDPYTSSHERRVAELACLIAERLDWSEEAVERLRIAALVHDIGKIAVPAEILSKPSRLTETEFALIKAHSAAAYEILAPIDFGGPVAEIVLQHHERLDGSGYPRGLSGDQVLPGARLLAVADVVEAMVTHRPYRAALPLEEALAEIEGGAGTRYDAGACAAALRLFRDEGFAFRK